MKEHCPQLSLGLDANELLAKRQELGCISKEVAEKELDLEDARSSLRRFNRRYFRIVGEKYVVLDGLLAQVAEVLAAKDPKNQEAQVSAGRARHQAEATAKEFEGIEKHDPIATSVQASDECRKLYRQIASIIHPDKALDQQTKEIRTRLMAALNASYANRDVAAMRSVLAEWHESPEAVSGVGPAVDLARIVRTISQLRRRIAELDEALSDLIESDMYRLMVAVREAESRGRDMLSEMAQDIECRITQARQRLASVE